jgi:hypothetical protein
MAGDDLKKVRPGDPFKPPAKWFNATIDLIKARGIGNVGQELIRSQDDNNRVLVENNSGSNRDQFHILGIDDGIVFSPTDNLDEFKYNYALVGETPNENYHTGRFCIIQQPIDQGALGEAIVCGLAVCQINILSESHTRADVSHGVAAYLESNAHGSAKILYKESGTGVKWAVIKIGGSGARVSHVWQGYLSSDVTITSTTGQTVAFTELKNNSDGMFTFGAAGYDVKVLQDGIFQAHICAHTEESVVSTALFGSEIWLQNDDSGGTDVEKMAIKQTWVGVSWTHDQHAYRGEPIFIDAGQSFRIRARYESGGDQYNMVGAGATSRNGCTWGLRYLGPDIESQGSSSGA